MFTMHLAHGGGGDCRRRPDWASWFMSQSLQGRPLLLAAPPSPQHPRVVWVSTSWSLSLMMMLGPRNVTSLLMSRAIGR